MAIGVKHLRVYEFRVRGSWGYGIQCFPPSKRVLGAFRCQGLKIRSSGALFAVVAIETASDPATKDKMTGRTCTHDDTSRLGIA